MGFSVSLPTIGQPNSTEDVKVNNSLTAIQTWGNGNILGSDLSSSAAIALSQLAVGWGKLAVRITGTGVTAANGDLVVPSASLTVTLPAAPATNTVIGVLVGYNATGASAVTVAAGGSAKFYGAGMSPGVPTSFLLGSPGASAVMQFDGSNWGIVAGQQDTGWVAMSLPGSWTTGGGQYVAASRTIGDRVWLSGVAVNGTGGSASLAVTLAAAFRPAAGNITVPIAFGAVTAAALSVTSAGALSVSPAVPNGGAAYMDNVSYRLV